MLWNILCSRINMLKKWVKQAAMQDWATQNSCWRNICPEMSAFNSLTKDIHNVHTKQSTEWPIMSNCGKEGWLDNNKWKQTWDNTLHFLWMHGWHAPLMQVACHQLTAIEHSELLQVTRHTTGQSSSIDPASTFSLAAGPTSCRPPLQLALFMFTLCNTAGHYIFALWLVSSFFIFLA